jgi:hypothetical protein
VIVLDTYQKSLVPPPFADPRPLAFTHGEDRVPNVHVVELHANIDNRRYLVLVLPL